MRKRLKIICPKCSSFREVSYAHSWAIKTGKETGICRKCMKIKYNKTGLKLGQGWNRGLKISGMTGKKQTKQHREKIAISNCGKKMSEEAKAKMSAAKIGKVGPLSSRWQGGKTRGQAERLLTNYKIWRAAIFKRDNYTCNICYIRGGILEAHHIKSYAKHPDLRVELSNGITLCKKCHRSLHFGVK